MQGATKLLLLLLLLWLYVCFIYMISFYPFVCGFLRTLDNLNYL